MYSKVTQLYIYIYIYSFSNSFPISVITEYWAEISVLYNRSLLVVCVCAQSLSCVWLFAIPWTIAHQAPLSTEFSRQEYWSGLPFPIPGVIFLTGIELMSLESSALTSRFFTTAPSGKPSNQQVSLVDYLAVCTFQFHSLSLPPSMSLFSKSVRLFLFRKLSSFVSFFFF